MFGISGSAIRTLLMLFCYCLTVHAEWHRALVVGETDAPPHSIVVKDSLVFFSEHKKIALTCVNGNSGERLFTVEGKETSNREWESKGLFIVDDYLVQIYSHFQHLYVRAVNKKGRTLYESTFPYAESGVVVELSVTDDKALIALHGKAFSLKKASAVILVDLKKGKVLKETLLPGLRRSRGNLTGRGITIFTAEQQKIPAYVAFDNRTGQKLWTYEGGKGHYFRASLCDDSLLVCNDGRKSVYLVDARTGKELKKTTVEQSKPVPYAYPLITKDKATYVAFDKLTRLGEEFTKRAVTAKSAWLTGNILVIDSQLIAHTSDSLFVYDRIALTRRKSFENALGWSFEGSMLPFQDGFILVNRFRRNYDYDTELWFFRQREVGYWDLSSIDTATALYNRGRFLAMGGSGILSLPAATYNIDLLGGGKVPRRLSVEIEAGDTIALTQAETARKDLVQGAVKNERCRLPEGYTLQTLIEKKARTVSHPMQLRKAKTLMESQGILFGAGSQHGLVAYDPKKEKIVWHIPPEELIRVLNPLKLRRHGRPEFYIANSIPEKDMIIVVTEEYMTNRFGAFDMNSGKLLWVAPIRVPLAYKSSSSGRFSTPFNIYDGLLWGKTNYAIYALDLESGNKVFEKIVASGNKSQWGNLIFGDSSLIYYIRYGNQGFLHSISLYEQKNKFTLPIAPPVELFHSPKENSFYLLRKGQIREYSLQGKLLHATNLKPRITDMEPVFDKERIYLTSNFSSQFHAVNRKDLKKLWSYTGSGTFRDPAPVLAGDSDVASTSDGSVIQIFDGKSGLVTGKIPESSLPLGKVELYWQDNRALYLSTFSATYIFDK